MIILQLYSEQSIGAHFDDCALHLNVIFFTHGAGYLWTP